MNRWDVSKKVRKSFLEFRWALLNSMVPVIKVPKHQKTSVQSSLQNSGKKPTYSSLVLLVIALDPTHSLVYVLLTHFTPSYFFITPLSPSVISSSLIMNPTGVLFIRQARGKRPASQADPATLSSLGIWHRNFNRRSMQAGRSVLETHCECQSELTNRREHSKCAVLLAWQSVTSVEERKKDRQRMMASGKGVVKGSRGTTLRYWAAIQVRGEG